MAELKLADIVSVKYYKDCENSYVLKAESTALLRKVVYKEAEIIPFEEFFTVEVKLVGEYCKEFGGVKAQSIDYLVANGRIDYAKVGKTVIIVMTDFTRSYIPNKSKNRDTLGSNIERV